MKALFQFFASVKEKDHSNTELPKEDFFATYLSVFRNKPDILLLVTYALNLTGLNLLQGILAYYTKYMYQDEGLTTTAMVMLLLIAMVCIPISVLVSKRIGKKLTYQFSFAMMTLACAGIFLFAHTIGSKFFLAMMAVAGIGVGFVAPLPFFVLVAAIIVIQFYPIDEKPYKKIISDSKEP